MLNNVYSGMVSFLPLKTSKEGKRGDYSFSLRAKMIGFAK